MNWLFLVIISAITLSLSRVLQKVLLKDQNNNNPVVFAFVFGLSVAAIMLIWALVDGFSFPNLIPLAPNLVLMSLFYALANVLLFKAFKLTEASEVAILLASSTIWSVLSAIIMLGEKLTPIKIAATLLVFSGVAFVYYSKSKWNLNKGHFYAILSAIFFGIAFTNDVFIVDKFKNVSSYMFMAFLLPSLTVILFDLKSISYVRYFIRPKMLAKLAILALFYGISAITVYQAYKNGGEASVISPIMQTSVLMIVFISYIFLKERNNVLNKLIGGGLVIAGVLMIK